MKPTENHHLQKVEMKYCGPNQTLCDSWLCLEILFKIERLLHLQSTCGMDR